MQVFRSKENRQQEKEPCSNPVLEDGQIKTLLELSDRGTHDSCQVEFQLKGKRCAEENAENCVIYFCQLKTIYSLLAARILLIAPELCKNT